MSTENASTDSKPFDRLVARPATNLPNGTPVDWHIGNMDLTNVETVGDYVRQVNEHLAAAALSSDSEPEVCVSGVVNVGGTMYAVRPVCELVEVVGADEVAEVLPSGCEEGELECADCGSTWNAEHLTPLTPEKLFAIVEPGDVVPVGLCPACGGAAS